MAKKKTSRTVIERPDTPKGRRSKLAKQIWALRRKHGNPTDRVRNYTEQIKTSDGKTVFINVDESRGKWRAEGYEVSGRKIKRVSKPKVAIGETESDAYDKLVMQLEKNPSNKLTPDERRELIKRPGLWMYFPTFRIAWFGGQGFVKQKWPRKRNPSAEYKKAAEAMHAQTLKFHAIRDKYRKREIGDTEFLAARESYRSAEREFDKHFEREQARNPKSKRNLDEIDQAAALTEQFQGRPAEAVTETVRGDKMRDDFSHFGWQEQFVFMPPSDVAELDCRAISNFYHERYERHSDSAKAWREVQEEFDIPLLVYDVGGDKIELVCSADGKQLYFLGKKQAGFREVLDDFRTDRDKDRVDLGELLSVTYTAQKSQLGDTEETGYYHVFGEEGGTPPRAFFDMLNNEIVLFGGTYHLNEAERGIIN